MTTELDLRKLPRHLAIIMDGNGRWAQARGLGRLEGHRVGAETVRTITRVARHLGIKFLTLYAFSHENWQRPRLEVEGLMLLLGRYLQGELDEMLKNDIRLVAMGDLTRLPPSVGRLLKNTMDQTRDNQEMRLTLALSYGGRPEILRACRRIVADCRSGKFDPDTLDEEAFRSYLDCPDLPDPDLLIRTGGEHRLSNFLLWQTAYSEIYVTQTAWPDFGEAELTQALIDFQSRQRRFGLTGEQVSGSDTGT